jgi:chorismate dehydratase
LQTKIRVGAVSYLNTKPLIYGFQHGMMTDQVDLKIDFPSQIATLLIKDQIDVGLVPVVAIPELKEHYIISDYGISCDGEVASVCLFSEVPLTEIETILLDYQSRTSVELLKVLVTDFWRITPEFKDTSGEYRSEIKGNTAALLIGDRALTQRKVSRYIFDLGFEWEKFTGLPFVFAAWVSDKKLDEDFIKSFNESNAYGLSNLEAVIAENPNPEFDLNHYYHDCINFRLDTNKINAMQYFLKKIAIKG